MSHTIPKESSWPILSRGSDHVPYYPKGVIVAYTIPGLAWRLMKTMKNLLKYPTLSRIEPGTSLVVNYSPATPVTNTDIFFSLFPPGGEIKFKTQNERRFTQLFS
jgi:hypothetical protein